MRNPKPINIRVNTGWAQIKVIGYQRKWVEPYLFVESGNNGELAGRSGFIEDRDIKRLRDWCDNCLAKRKPRKK